MKRRVTIEVDDGSDVDQIFEKVWTAVDKTFAKNLDALHDVLTEFGPRWRIVFRNAGAALNGLRAVCEDAMAETPGLEIIFEN